MPPVPTITDVRDAAGADPCALVTPEQLAGAGLGGAGTAVPADEGPRCRWRSGAGSLDLTLYTDGEGLATIAANSEPTTTRVRLDGYPALETFTGRGEFCQYDVGVSASQVVMAALEAPDPDSCEVLQRLLPGVLDNLPAPGEPGPDR
ncbi:DUF3558 family protein [Pseudonocardia sp. S2-4]|uniref:DUF3558 family protein n=1 Tax=Pseudonocardia humida TaxID=2800819 RepID=A0ABT1A5Q2_9PSEU|nr:DUF3558 family protein [Pseudonocardia humida]